LNLLIRNRAARDSKPLRFGRDHGLDVGIRNRPARSRRVPESTAAAFLPERPASTNKSATR